MEERGVFDFAVKTFCAISIALGPDTRITDIPAEARAVDIAAIVVFFIDNSKCR